MHSSIIALAGWVVLALVPLATPVDIKTVEASPEGGLSYRIIMSGAAAPDNPDRLIVWLHPTLKPNTKCVAYGHLFVESPRDQKATAYVGVNDAGKLFINGELVWAVPGIHQLKADEYAVPIHLKAGWNEVLIKACQYEEEWGFAFRVQDPKLELTYSVTKRPPDEN